jgi:hypothetical protein
MDKNAIIDKIYHDPAGYGSMAFTLKHARQKDPSINMEDVKRWYSENVEKTGKMRGYNSFVAHAPFEEFQLDLLFFTEPNLEFNVGLLIIDIFTKYCVVIPIKTKKPDEVFRGTVEGFKKMGGLPKVLYTDNEGSFNSTLMQQYMKENDIFHIITLSHAAFAERMIRTFKNMIYKRIGKSGKPWYDFIYPILLTYNNLMTHSVTKMTPNEARQPKSHLTVKMNLELNAKRTRYYPELSIGDHVKVYKKKKAMDKERVSNWSENQYEIIAIEEQHDQPFYKLAGRDKFYMRSELLKV